MSELLKALRGERMRALNCKRVVIHLGEDISNKVIAFEIKPPTNDASGYIYDSDIELRMADGSIIPTDTRKTEITLTEARDGR